MYQDFVKAPRDLVEESRICSCSPQWISWGTEHCPLTIEPNKIIGQAPPTPIFDGWAHEYQLTTQKSAGCHNLGATKAKDSFDILMNSSCVHLGWCHGSYLRKCPDNILLRRYFPQRQRKNFSGPILNDKKEDEIKWGTLSQTAQTRLCYFSGLLCYLFACGNAYIVFFALQFCTQ